MKIVHALTILILLVIALLQAASVQIHREMLTELEQVRRALGRIDFNTSDLR